MPRELLSMIITAMIAGAIGFGVAVYAVPPEEAMQFRALVDAGLGVRSQTARSANTDAGVTPLEAQPRGPRESTREPAAAASPPNDTPNRNSATPSASPTEGGGERQAPTSDKPARITTSPPSAAQPEKTPVSTGRPTKRPEKKSKAKNASPGNTENRENRQ